MICHGKTTKAERHLKCLPLVKVKRYVVSAEQETGQAHDISSLPNFKMFLPDNVKCGKLANFDGSCLYLLKLFVTILLEFIAT